MLENKVRMKYIGIIYDCTLIGTKHKNKQVLINDHKDLNNLIQEMDKKTKGQLRLASLIDVEKSF